MKRLFRILFYSLFLVQSLAAAPFFLDPPAEDGRWQPALDSSSCRLIDLNGEWHWLEKKGGATGRCQIPSCFRDTNSPLIFKRHFTLPENNRDLETRLWLGGVNHSCRVEINGKFIGAHANGSTSLELAIPHSLLNHGGDNRIEIRVERRLSPKNTIPLKAQNWDPLNYGGLYRELYLLQKPRLRVDDLSWTLKEGRRQRKTLQLNSLLRNTTLVKIDSDTLGGPAQVKVKARLLGANALVLGSGELKAEIPRHKSPAAALEFSLSEARLWSPEDPVLYTLEVELWQDQFLRHRVTRAIAFRDFSIQQGELQLNGQHLKLKGVEWIAEHPQSGIALSPVQLAADLESIKNLGANLILSSQGAVHPLMIDLCNRNGMLLIQELPAHHVPPLILAREEFHQLAASYLKEMILRDRQQPCLLGISLGKGFVSNNQATADFFTSLYSLRDLAPKLFLTASLMDGPVPEALGLDLLLLESGSANSKTTVDPGLPLVIRGVGLPVENGNQEGYANPWSALRQARYIQQVLLEIRESTFLDGAIVSALADWRGARPLLWAPPGEDRMLCPLGIMTADRDTRAAYHEVRSIYGSSSGTTLTQGEYSPDHPLEYPMTGFLLLILMLVVLKQNKVFAQNLKRSFVHSHGFFSDVQSNRIYQFGQSLFIGFLVCFSSGLLLSSLLFYLRKNLLFDHLLSQLVVLNVLKEQLANLAWQPLFSVLYLGSFTLLLALATAVGIRILGLLFNARFSLTQSLTFLAFSGAPLLFFILLGSVLYRILQIEALLIPVLVLVFMLLVWAALRLMRCMRIAFAGAFPLAALLVLVGFVVIVGLIFVYYENNHSLVEYLRYYWTVYGP